MYRFSRKATLINAAITPAAVAWSAEVSTYLNKAHNLHVKAGVQLFGHQNMHWQFEVDSLDKISALNQKLLTDKSYQQMLEKGKEFWVDGSVKDEIVNFMG